MASHIWISYHLQCLEICRNGHFFLAYFGHTKICSTADLYSECMQNTFQEFQLTHNKATFPISVEPFKLHRKRSRPMKKTSQNNQPPQQLTQPEETLYDRYKEGRFKQEVEIVQAKLPVAPKRKSAGDLPKPPPPQKGKKPSPTKRVWRDIYYNIIIILKK